VRDVEMAATALAISAVKVAVLGARIRAKQRPTAVLLLPGRYRLGILAGLVGPVLFAAVTDSGPVRWLADWKLHRFGLRSPLALTAIQLFFASLILAMLLLYWLGKRRRAELGPERSAAALAEAAAEAKRAEKNVPRQVVIGLSVTAVLGLVMFAAFRGPLRLPPAVIMIGQALSAASLFGVAAIVISVARRPV